MPEKIQSPSEIAESVYSRVFRTDFSQPGFALINLGPDCGSETQRQLMIDLKNEFDRLERRYRGRQLGYQSLTRFDQQVTTKPHRDGGPDESILMLGYEPSLIESRLEMSDYSKCAYDLSMTPTEFLDQFNPMFPDGQNRLAAYTTPIDDFDNTSFQIMLINNSMKQFGDGLVGVLHTATIINPNPDLRRIINSTMIASVPQGHGGSISVDEQNDFVTTAVVRRPVYG
ncbi:MAG: hypothetical protein DWI15_01925 [Planctomycetota bacterium]|nr:MAG: hypothetical protein DWI15_01925 [Planctomycetota bacterium]